MSPNNYGSKNVSNSFTIKPIIALDKNEWLPFEQFIRIKFQVPTIPSSSKTTRGTFLGDTQFFDLFIVEEPNFGRWGIGPMGILPTASALEAGQGKWQIGPAFGISMLKISTWQFGFLAQNPISFAGNSHKSRQNYLLFQPFIIHHFKRNTYIITNGEWTIDWVNNTKMIPVNIGIGHTFHLKGKINLDTTLQYEWMAYQNARKSAGYVNQSTIQLSLSLLFD